MIIKRYVLGMCMTNCYLIIDEKSKECAIIDAGDIAPLIENDVVEEDCTVKYIFFTHGHFDHIGGLEYYMSKYDKSLVLMHKNDVDSIVKGYDVFSVDFKNIENVVKNITLHNDGDVFKLGNMNMSIIYTPGHTKGSVCIYSDGILFSGDTLFEHSVGRTDFIDGDFNELEKSIYKLYNLPDNTKVYPGHGNITFIGNEKQSNPFVRL